MWRCSWFGNADSTTSWTERPERSQCVKAGHVVCGLLGWWSCRM